MATDTRVAAKNVAVQAKITALVANASQRAASNPEQGKTAQTARAVGAPIVTNSDIPANLVTYAELPPLANLTALGYDIPTWLANVNVVDTDDTRNAIQSGAALLTAAPAPTLTSASPATGGIAGGTTVNLVGTHFSPDSVVKFGGVTAPTVTYVDPQHLTVVTPATTAGSRPVAVTTPAGTTGTQPFTSS